MNSTFYACNSLTSLDLRHFDVTKVTNTSTMFAYCYKLETIYCSDTWTIPVAASDNMFINNEKLVGAVPHNNSKVTAEMANPHTGYFTGYWYLQVNAHAPRTHRP